MENSKKYQIILELKQLKNELSKIDNFEDLDVMYSKVKNYIYSEKELENIYENILSKFSDDVIKSTEYAQVYSKIYKLLRKVIIPKQQPTISEFLTFYIPEYFNCLNNPNNIKIKPANTLYEFYIMNTIDITEQTKDIVTFAKFQRILIRILNKAPKLMLDLEVFILALEDMQSFQLKYDRINNNKIYDFCYYHSVLMGALTLLLIKVKDNINSIRNKTENPNNINSQEELIKTYTQKLSPQETKVFEAIFHSKFSMKEVAAHLDLKTSNVRSIIERINTKIGLGLKGIRQLNNYT